jgi:hypothetical protein
VHSGRFLCSGGWFFVAMRFGGRVKPVVTLAHFLYHSALLGVRMPMLVLLGIVIINNINENQL